MKKLTVLLVSLLVLSCTNDENPVSQVDLVKTTNVTRPTIPVNQTVALHLPSWFKGNYYALTNTQQILLRDRLYVTDSTMVRIQEIITTPPFGNSVSTFIKVFKMNYFDRMVTIREEEGVLNGLKFYKVWDVDVPNGNYILKFWITQRVVNPAEMVTWKIPDEGMFRKL